jgi:hypothetical protein
MSRWMWVKSSLSRPHALSLYDTKIVLMISVAELEDLGCVIMP